MQKVIQSAASKSCLMGSILTTIYQSYYRLSHECAMRLYRRVFCHYLRDMRLLHLGSKNQDQKHRMLKIILVYIKHVFHAKGCRNSSLSANRSFPREAQPAAKVSFGLQTETETETETAV